MKVRHRADITAKQPARALAVLGSEGTKLLALGLTLLLGCDEPCNCGAELQRGIPTPVYPPKRTLKCNSSKAARSWLIAFYRVLSTCG